MLNIRATIEDVSVKPVDAYYEFKIKFSSPGEANIRTVDLEENPDLDLENVVRNENVTSGLLHVYFADGITTLSAVRKVLRDAAVVDDNAITLDNVYYGFTIFFGTIDNTNMYELDNLKREVVSINKLFHDNHASDILPLMTEVSGNTYGVGKSHKGYNLQYNAYIKVSTDTDHPIPDTYIFQEARAKFLSILDKAGTQQDSKRTVKDDKKQQRYHNPITDVSFSMSNKAEETVDKYKTNKWSDPLLAKKVAFEKSLETILKKLTSNRFNAGTPIDRTEDGEPVSSNFETFTDKLSDWFANANEIVERLEYYKNAPDARKTLENNVTHLQDSPIKDVKKVDNKSDLKQEYSESYSKYSHDQLSKYYGIDNTQQNADLLKEIQYNVSGEDNPNSLRALMNDIITYYSENIWESLSNLHKIEESYAKAYTDIYYKTLPEEERKNKKFPGASEIIQKQLWGRGVINLEDFIFSILKGKLSISDNLIKKIADALANNNPQVLWDFYNTIRSHYKDILGEVDPEKIQDLRAPQEEQKHPMLDEKNQDKFLEKLTHFDFDVKDILPEKLLNYTEFNLNNINEKVELNKLVKQTQDHFEKAKEELKYQDAQLENKLHNLQEEHKNLVEHLTQSKALNSLSDQIDLENAETTLEKQIFKVKQEREKNKVKYQTIVNLGFPFLAKVIEYLQANNAYNVFERKDK